VLLQRGELVVVHVRHGRRRLLLQLQLAP
jgi:hypothetical protein